MTAYFEIWRESLPTHRAVRRSVEVGQRNGVHAQVVSGLQDGAQVITHPDASIDDGARVRLR